MNSRKVDIAQRNCALRADLDSALSNNRVLRGLALIGWVLAVGTLIWSGL